MCEVGKKQASAAPMSIQRHTNSLNTNKQDECNIYRQKQNTEKACYRSGMGVHIGCGVDGGGRNNSHMHISFDCTLDHRRQDTPPTTPASEAPGQLLLKEKDHIRGPGIII